MMEARLSHTLRMGAALAVLMTAASCAAQVPATPFGTGSGAPPSAVQSPSAAASSAATAPPELYGNWESTIATGEHATLTLGPTSYLVNVEGDTGSGSITVEGDDIVFVGIVCQTGPGHYRWSLDDGELVFVPLEPRDPCPGRIRFLEDVTYARPD